MSENFVTVVSGMPRSGTSLMMRMLEAGGLPLLTDGLRLPDEHNPLGYFEYEPVKRLAQDSSWMPAARGKAIKIICWLLPYLPDSLDCRVVFMERDIEEIFASQRDMLVSRGDPAARQPAGPLISALAAGLRDAKQWLAARPNVRTLMVPYAEVLRDPARWAAEISRFLGATLTAPAMRAAVEPSLHRHRARGRRLVWNE
jgi:hypothetical protein